MHFIKVPMNFIMLDIHHAILHVYIMLLQQHFIFCGKDYDKEFWITDRDLADICRCSRNTVFRAKKYLKRNDMIVYRKGHKNKTFYKLITE